MRNVFIETYRFFVRSTAFIGKEIMEVFRQTPLILTLVLGPFLIMLLFGVGYQGESRPMRTLLVMQKGDPLQQSVENQLTSLGDSLIYKGTISDQKTALQELQQGKVDMVVVFPPGALDMVRSNQQVVVQFYHNEIDPFQVNYMEYISNAYIGEVNRRIVFTYAEQGQESASTLEQKLTNAHQQVEAMREALKAGSATPAQDTQQLLNGEIDAISFLIGGSMYLTNGLSGQVMDGNATHVTADNQAIEESLSQLQMDNQQLGAIQAGQSSYQSELLKLDQLDSDIANLEAQLKNFQSVDPGVLVAPFKGQAVGLQGASLKPVDFFAPAVLILLLQHMAVTLSALAIVREQRSGSMELFHISPLSSLEMLLGKYLSYLIFGAMLAVVITVTMVLALKVPMHGTWLNYGIVVLTLLFTSLGIGFLLSLIAKSEMQAVQYAMFILLGSVFFSGFFLDLRYLWAPVRAFSWMLPATYAIDLMQSLMLRGGLVDIRLYSALLGIGVGLFVLAWFLLRRRLQVEWS
ncbi:MAG: putative type transporter [Chloroflexi bacterium]|nr:putative type transporter [Chloroflexota bacterium]